MSGCRTDTKLAICDGNRTQTKGKVDSGNLCFLEQSEVVHIDEPTKLSTRHERAANTRTLEERIVQKGHSRLRHGHADAAHIPTAAAEAACLAEVASEQMELEGHAGVVPRELQKHVTSLLGIGSKYLKSSDGGDAAIVPDQSLSYY